MGKYVAKPYVAGTPEATVSGQAMIAFSSNLQAELIDPILKNHGLEHIDENQWYPHQLWMDVLKEVEDTLGGNANSVFIAFGKRVVETAVMPDTMQTVDDALNALHAIHHANLRDIPEDEGYFVEKLGEGNYIVYHNTPNPDTAIYGFLWGMVVRFKAPDEMFVVEYTDNTKPQVYPGSAYSIRWGKTVDDIRKPSD